MKTRNTRIKKQLFIKEQKKTIQINNYVQAAESKKFSVPNSTGKVCKCDFFLTIVVPNCREEVCVLFFRLKFYRDLRSTNKQENSSQTVIISGKRQIQAERP